MRDLKTILLYNSTQTHQLYIPVEPGQSYMAAANRYYQQAGLIGRYYFEDEHGEIQQINN